MVTFFIRRRRSRSIIIVYKATSNMELKKINTKVEAYKSWKQKTITPTKCMTVIGVENLKSISSQNYGWHYSGPRMG